jgi:hypothetical protein
MQLLLDHLSAIIIASVVILILSVTQIRSSHASVEQTATHSVKAKTLVFGHWIERDILDIGRNMGRNRYRFNPPVLDAAGNTREFRFFSDSACSETCTFPSGFSGAPGDTVRLHTRYILVPTRTVTVTRDGSDLTRQLYVLRREVAASRVTLGVAAAVPSTGWRADRWSIGTLSFFHVNMLLRDGTETMDPEAGDYIQIQFGVVPEWILQPENFIRELYWTTTLKIRPFWEPPRETS